MSARTTVHLLRHGEVHNPTGVLYGRLDGYHLSDLGRQMAQRVADAHRRPRHHARGGLAAGAGQETAAPSPRPGLEVGTDARVIESSNVFEGKRFGVGDNVLRSPRRGGTCGTRSGRRGASPTRRSSRG